MSAIATTSSSPAPGFSTTMEQQEEEERLVIDPYTRIIYLNYLNPYPGAPMSAEPVPEGVNIFNMMNLSVPENVSELGEWTIMINPNSSKYDTLKNAFNVSIYAVTFFQQKIPM